MRSAEEVVRGHIAAFETRDANAVVADYAEDAVLQTRDGVVRGRDAIRAAFESTLELLPPGTDLTIDSFSVAHDVVFVTWHAETEAFSLPLVADTHIVRDGEIVAQTMAYHVTASTPSEGTTTEKGRSHE